MRVALDECIKNGEADESILQKYAKQAESQLGHALTPKEADILKMLFYEEKVKMRESGFIK